MALNFLSVLRLSVYPLVWFLAVCLTTTGCGDFNRVKPLGNAALLQEIADTHSVILMNLTYTLERVPGKTYPEDFFGRRPSDTRIEVTDLSRSGPPKYIDRVFATSHEDLQEGWLFFSLDPGLYYLKIYQVDGCALGVGLSVPSGKHVIYAGAYQREVQEEKGEKDHSCAFHALVEGDLQLQARAIAYKYFASLGPLEISLAAEAFDNPTPLGIAHKEEFALEPIDWVGRGQDRAVSKVPVLGSCGTGTAAGIGLSILCTGVVALGATGIGSISGSSSPRAHCVGCMYPTKNRSFSPGEQGAVPGYGRD